MCGVRTAAINIVATATIGPLIGVLTLGDFILNRNVYGDAGVLAGAILVALLALILELVGRRSESADPEGRRAAAASPRRAPHRIRVSRPCRRRPHKREEPPHEQRSAVAIAVCALAVVASRSESSPAAMTTTIRATAVEERRADRVEPQQRRGQDHGRLQELHRAVHPRRDLRPGSEGGRLRRQQGPEPRVRAVALKALEDGEITGYPEYTSTALTSFFNRA